MPEASSPSTSASLVKKTTLVSAGMLLSRIAGFARQALLSGVFGLSAEADAFGSALRIPNFLQNLFGDGVLSASLIPVYARLVKSQGREEADRVARTVLAILALLTSGIVLVGIITAPQLVHLISPGFVDAKRDLTITLVRIMFPGVGLLVGSAWCLAILNTHGKFFNSYAAPTLWNAAIMAAVWWYRHDTMAHVAVAAAWGVFIGCVLQVSAQLPQVLRVMTAGWLRTRLVVTDAVREVIQSSIPVILSRGAVQVSAFIDTSIASLLPDGAVAALGNAQSLYMFPVSLFGMSISSAALPSMSAVSGETRSRALADHLVAGQRMLLVLMVPSVVAFVAFGDLMVSLLFQHGRFNADDSRYVWAVLAGSAVGLIATTVGRFYASAFYALGDTKTPARFAFIRIGLVVSLGFAMALWLPGLLHLDARWGAPGLTLSAGLAGWVEFALLRTALRQRIDDFHVPVSFMARCWAMAIVAAAMTTGLRWMIPVEMRYTRDLVMLIVFGVLYLSGAVAIGAITITDLRRRLKR